jgi:HAD superfamily hydrolase (TIGR01509 family)
VSSPVVSIRGVVFDLDGVLADTERLHWQAYRQVLLEYGVDVPLADYAVRFTATGRGPEWACATYGLPITPDELRARKAPVYLALLEAGAIPCPGARAAVERLRATHRVAVATNAARAEVTVVLDQLGLQGRLHAIVAREDYRNAKPAPDAYVAAAAALGFVPGECVAIEDSPRGVDAAVAAGLRVVAVPNELTRTADLSAAQRRLGHLDELTATLLEEIAREPVRP